MAFDLTDEELQATREMNKTAWESEIDKWSKEYLIERYKDLVEIEKEHKKENGELREKIKELENADLTTVYMSGFYDGENKWKDKIKERIEFYKRYGKIKNSNEYVMSVEIEVLEELLEERN